MLWVGELMQVAELPNCFMCNPAVQKAARFFLFGNRFVVLRLQKAFRTKMQRVFVCGAHSTGKSTLVQEVSKRIPHIHVESEVARRIIRDLKLSREDFDPQTNPRKFEELQERIIEAQCVLERRNALLGRSYIADRGPDPLIYATLYLGWESTQRLLRLPTTLECLDRLASNFSFNITSSSSILEMHMYVCQYKGTCMLVIECMPVRTRADVCL